MQVLCKLLFTFYIISVYDVLYSTVHPMNYYVESDVMWYKQHSVHKYCLLFLGKPQNLSRHGGRNGES